MAIDGGRLKGLVEAELERLRDARVVAQIRGLLVEPRPVLRAWDYGEPGQKFPCWAVLNDDDSRTGIAYCESGFGPRCPWGLVWLGSDKPEHMSIGMDCNWYVRFLDAYFECAAASRLPIWRVFKSAPSGIREPITDEDSWDATWERVMLSRNADPAARYDCWHSITY